MKLFVFICLIAFALRGAAQTVPDSTVEMRFRVFYPVGKTELQEDYMGNAQTLYRIRKYLETSSRIDSITINSSASPEGPYLLNRRLAAGRGKSFKQYLLSHLPAHRHLPDSLIIVDPTAENWQGLYDLVLHQYSLDDKEEVLAVLRRADISNERRKVMLKRLKHGQSWKYILKELMPQLRYATWVSVWQRIEAEKVLKPEVCLKVDMPEVDFAWLKPVDVVPNKEEPVQYEPMLNVHTNLLYDAATALNVGVEYYPRNSRWTVVANYTFPWWSKDKNHRYLQLIDGELQVRRYFDQSANHAGHYLAAYVHANYYDFSFDAKRAWQGEGVGLGLGYGYVWRPWKDKRWKLEAFVRLGYYHSLYDPYHASDPYNGKYYYDWDGAVEDFERRNYRFRWFGPTGLGITLSYDLLQRKLKY